MKEVLKNPMLSWLKWIFHYYNITRKNQTLMLGNMAFINNSKLGLFNLICQNCSVSNSSLGDYSYLNVNTTINHALIGKFCSIGENVKIGLGKHPAKQFVSSHPAFYTGKKKHYFSKEELFTEYEQTIIGSDVWIGANSIIMDGVKIGNGAIIGAGSVVTKNVNDYEIVGGVPAKLIRKRFSEEEIAALLNINWWDWDLEKIKNKAPEFVNINEFIKKN